MMVIRRSNERGHVKQGWLESFHTFSFADYYDPRHMHFRHLRVINEDWIAAGAGFPTHPHRDMEILTYVIEGALEHRDSMGSGSVIRPGDVQRMSAGTGVFHSEMNASKTDPVHLLQIWILPSLQGAPPGYEQKTFAPAEKLNRLCLIASGDGRGGSLSLNQNVAIYATALESDRELRHVPGPGRHTWIQVVRGPIELGGASLGPGDAAAISDPSELVLRAREPAELLIFDLP